MARGVSDDELAGPLKGINALALDNPADIHQHIRELGEALQIVPEPAEAYLAQLDQVVAPSIAELDGVDDSSPDNRGAQSRALIKGLSDDAIELLCAAATDPAGGALAIDRQVGLSISAAGRIFTGEDNRSQARWSAA